MTLKFWQLGGVGFFVLLIVALTLEAEGRLPVSWEYFEGAVWATIFWYAILGVVVRSRRSTPEDGRSDVIDVRANQLASRPLIDPWDCIPLCKQGKMEYQAVVGLCEDQMAEGDGNSAACLAWLYEYGPPEIRDRSRAMPLYRRAALLGHEAALDQLIAKERVEAQHAVMTDEQKSAQMASILEKIGAAAAEVKRERAST